MGFQPQSNKVGIHKVTKWASVRRRQAPKKSPHRAQQAFEELSDFYARQLL